MRRLLFVLAFTCTAAEPVPEGMKTIHKAKGVIIHADPAAAWCTYGPVQLEQARLEPEPSKDGKQARPLSSKEQALADQFLGRLNSDLSISFANLRDKRTKGHTLVVSPVVRRLNRNNPWLNVVGLAALQAPLTGSGMTLELALRDADNHRPVGYMLLVSKGFWASQVDLNRYRYAVSKLGQAQAIAKARGLEAAKQLDRLLACDTPSRSNR